MTGPVSAHPEQPVWDWLAAHGVPFAVPTATLVSAHGTVAPGPGRDPVCVLPGTPLVRHQLRGLAVDVARLRGATAPPTHLHAPVYDGADGLGTFHAVSEDLAQHFGPATRATAGAASNTNVYSAEWAFGLAVVALTFWPARLNEGFSTFAYPDPLRWKASSLRIEPAVMGDFSPTEAAALSTATRVGPARVPWQGPYANAAYWRRRPPGVADGVAVARDGSAVFVISERALVIPRDAVTGLSLYNLTPAKGGGGAGLRLDLAGGGGAALLDGATPFSLDDQAARLRDTLGVPLRTSTQPDA